MTPLINTPEARKDFEDNLENLILAPEKTNITLVDLRENYEGAQVIVSSSGANKFFSHRFFFNDGTYILNFPHAPPRLFYIPFLEEKYGFSDNDVLELKPLKLNLCLNEDSELGYNQILANPKVRINELLGITGYIINNSMRFSPESVNGAEMRDSNKVLELAGDSYKPTGEETMVGICSKAGDLIRSLLNSYTLPKNLRYIEASLPIPPVHHDVTLVFDKYDGRWAFINSKSPRLAFNLTSKEDLKRLGIGF